jgi:hypothetical protein
MGDSEEEGNVASASEHTEREFIYRSRTRKGEREKSSSPGRIRIYVNKLSVISFSAGSLPGLLFAAYQYIAKPTVAAPAPPSPPPEQVQLLPEQQVVRVGKTNNKDRVPTESEPIPTDPNVRIAQDLGPYLYKLPLKKGWQAVQVDPRKYANPNTWGPLPIDPPSVNAMDEVYEIQGTGFYPVKLIRCTVGIVLPGDTTPTKFCKESNVPRVNGLYRQDAR